MIPRIRLSSQITEDQLFVSSAEFSKTAEEEETNNGARVLASKDSCKENYEIAVCLCKFDWKACWIRAYKP